MAARHIAPLNLEYVEQLYAEYVEHPSRVPPEWRRYFEQSGDGNGQRAHAVRRPSIGRTSIFNPPVDGEALRPAVDLRIAERQECIDLLIREYRVRGHLVAQWTRLGRLAPARPSWTRRSTG